MLKRIAALATLIALMVVGLIFVATRNTSENSDGKLTVVASFYPLYDFAQQVGGEHVQVTNITPAGAEPHDYEPSAKTLADAKKADVFIYNGGDFEPWTEGFASDYAHRIVKASTGITLHEGGGHIHDDEAAEEQEGASEQDPHFWLDPVLAQHIVATISEGLVKADPAHKAYYEARAAKYVARLKALDEAFKDGLKHCTHDTIITSHDAFGYVAERYGFAVESIAGLSPDEEPSAARLAELADHVEEEGIGYVFFESLVSPRLADTIAQETGARTLVLDPIEGLKGEDQTKGKNYESVQRQNLANLRTALACQ